MEKNINQIHILLNFEFKKVFHWLGHSVPIKSSTVMNGSVNECHSSEPYH